MDTKDIEKEIEKEGAQWVSGKNTWTKTRLVLQNVDLQIKKNEVGLAIYLVL